MYTVGMCACNAHVCMQWECMYKICTFVWQFYICLQLIHTHMCEMRMCKSDVNICMQCSCMSAISQWRHMFVMYMYLCSVLLALFEQDYSLLQDRSPEHPWVEAPHRRVWRSKSPLSLLTTAVAGTHQARTNQAPPKKVSPICSCLGIERPAWQAWNCRPPSWP